MNIVISIKKLLTLFYHRGSKIQCPICEYKANTFVPGGIHTKRLNAKCPKCGCVERQRILWKFISEKSELKNEHSINLLHFAPEKALSKIMRRYFKNYKTSDFGNTKSDYSFDLMSIDCSDNIWDCIVCFHVLEHVPNDLLGMKEIHRILKPGGLAFIQVPIWPSELHPTYENESIIDDRDRKITFGQEDHFRIYGLDVINRLISVGFSVKPIRYKEIFTKEEIIRYALENTSGISEVFFICKK